MVLHIKHIDLISGEYLPNPFANQRQEQPYWIEKLSNSLLESFCPDISVSVGHLDEFYVQSSDPERIAQAEKILKNHPEGHKLILANGDRFFYAPAEYEPIINEILAGLDVKKPDLKNRGAYSSLLTSDQKSNQKRTATILIVDDETGENGGILDKRDAWKLTGDCHGKMSPQFASEVFKTNNRAIQFRIGLLEDKYIGKGTLTPRWLDGDEHELFRPLKFSNPANIPNIDLVLPLSSFKGTAKGNIKPGLITTEIVITEKDRSKAQKERGSLISASQPVQYYTEALKDTTPLLEQHLEKLQESIEDPRKLEQLYQKATLSGEAEESEVEENQFQDLISKLIENDKYGQLRETEFYKKKLEQFQAKQWKESAIGKFVKFNRAVVIPSKDLELGELYWNDYKPGESVLGFRSPMIGKNGLRVSTNKPVEEGLAPDGSPLEGVLVMNDFSWPRLHQQLTGQLSVALTTHPDKQPQLQQILEQLPTAKQLKDSSGKERVQLIDSINLSLETLIESGIPLTPLPYETDNEADGMDFDGDTYGFELIHNYPHLAQAARLHALNPDTPIKKEDKLSFDPSWSFERVALFMANSPVGVINNQVTTVQSFKNELDIYRDYAKPAQKREYAQKLANTANRLIATENREKNPRPIPPDYREQVYQIAQIATQPLDSGSAGQIFNLTEQIYDELLIEAQYNNQIAVDMFKSARPPSMARIQQDKGALYRKLETITDKKEQGLYTGDRILKATGVTPVELMAHVTNGAFRSESLESRPLNQFRDFFPNDYTEQQFLEVTEKKGEFDGLFNRATALRKEQENEPGPVLNFTTPKGNKVRITNLIAFNSISHFTPLQSQDITLSFVENDDKSTRASHQLAAQATLEGKTITLGTVKESDREKFNIQAGMTVPGTAKLGQALSDAEIDLLFKQAFDGAREWKELLPPEQIQQYFGATGHLACRELKNQANTTQHFLFAAFADELIDRSQTFQFKEFLVDKLKDYNEVPSQLFNEEVQLRVSPITIESKEGERIGRLWEVHNPEDDQWYSFGLSSVKGAQLPLNTTVTGQLSGENPATARLDIITPEIQQKLQPFFEGGGEIIFGQINKYAAAGEFFNGQTETFTLRRFTPETEYVVSVGDKTLGVVDRNLIAQIAQANSFKATLTTYGVDRGRYAIATLNNGEKLRINKIAFRGHDDFKGESLISEPVQLNIKATKAAEEVGVETIIDGFPQIIGVFGSHRDQNPGKQALTQAGLLKDGVTFEATITSRLTLGKLQINPDTIQYPPIGEWTKAAHLVPDEQKPKLNPEVAYFLNQVSTHPTLVSVSSEQWQLPNGKETTLPTFKITTDVRKAAAVEKYLADNKIPFAFKTSASEKQRSLISFAIVEGDLPRSIRSNLEDKFGTPLEEAAHQQRIGEISPFSRSVQQQFLERQELQAYLNLNPPEVPLRQLPILLSLTENAPVEILSPSTLPVQKDITNSPNAENRTSLPLISSDSKDPLLAALTNPTEAAHYKGNIKAHYPVSFRDNPTREAIGKDHPDYGYYKAEKYFSAKAAGVPFVSAEDGYKYYARSLDTHEQKEALMAEIIAAKLTQYPKLTLEIEKRGGVSYLEQCSHTTSANNSKWEGIGRDSAFIRALIKGYEEAILQKATFFDEQGQLKKPGLPGLLVPPGSSDAVERNRIKDRAMANLATQFIGIPANPDLPTSTKDYLAAWNLFDRGNTGKYTADDIVMVSGNLPRSTTKGTITPEQVQQTFDENYKPLLDRAISAGAQFVVGNAAGTDKLVQEYLNKKGYQLEQTEQGYLKSHLINQEISGQEPSISEVTLYIVTREEEIKEKNSKTIKSEQTTVEEITTVESEIEPSSTLIDPEFSPERLQIQQQRTQKVAPVLMALLEAKKLTRSPQLSYNPETNLTSLEGKDYDVTFDGKILNLLDKSGSLKMIASGVRNQDTGKVDWSSYPLPHGGEGLTESDEAKLTDPQFRQLVKEILLRAANNSTQKYHQNGHH
ncbi:ribonuclease H [Gloeothece verrucosa]|uniref:Uncharacterized protein n=1 Tax=Gloeothece verrucosa (strain PCC 7822) TaxID=497965 RepID=E0UMB8_GLOV7|nr:ribonuclease H [Gloeothece verrucosa]ADN18098.1 hypothetical protein Cyan7822_6298 [Gloeothece verrucosa PCC 7822]